MPKYFSFDRAPTDPTGNSLLISPLDYPTSLMTHFPHLSTSAGAPSRAVTGSPVPCKLMGNWQLDKLVGQGNYTSVFDARPLGCPPSWPADYVVKVVRAECLRDPLAVGAVRREAEVGRHSSHSNLVPILEAHLEAAPPHIVMPKLQGASLAAVIERVGPLVVPQALWLARQIAQALQHLHQQGWIHGDVKPANIMVSRQGHATLIDLAFAMRPDESIYSSQRPLAATLAYVAPEMLTSTTQTQPASDVYSLGVTLYQMISGRLPFLETTPARLVEAHFRSTPPPLLAGNGRLPEPVSQLVKRMLAKSPLRRPSSGEELIDALTELEIETMEARFPQHDAA
jgi:serine/threonine-protein kinase